jgi:DNA-binding CsgD family transcriptional regulator
MGNVLLPDEFNAYFNLVWLFVFFFFLFGAPALCAALTKREAEILALVKSGLSNSRIAAALCLAPHTVENILSILYDKTGAANRGELERLG